MGAVTKEAKERHKQMHEELRQWYKEHGICPRCKAWSEPGRVYCKNCMKKIIARQRKRDPTGEQHRAYSKERRARLKAAGMCTYCGKKPAVEGQVLCPSCKAKNKESQIKYKIHQRTVKEGLQWEP